MLGVIFNCNHELSLVFERELICFNSYSYDFYYRFFEATCMLFSNFMRAFHKEENINNSIILCIVYNYLLLR